MNKIYAVFIGFGCLIRVLPFIVHAMPLLLDLEEPLNAINQSSVPWNMTVEASKSEKDLVQDRQQSESGRMGLFPMAYQSKLRTADKAPGKTSVSATKRPMVARNLTDDALSFWAKPKASKPTVGREEVPVVSARAGEGAPRTKSLEKTISIPRMVSDHMGNWVFNPWAVTFGVIWQDTRMQHKVDKGMTRILVDTIIGNYNFNADTNHKKAKTKVCRGKSTIYNKPRVYKWLTGRLLLNDTPYYSTFASHRPVWLDLRRELYKMGKSEICHVAALDDWLKYNKCAILRNMRMEYLIPKYPLHQIGYYSSEYRKNLPYLND